MISLRRAIGSWVWWLDLPQFLEKETADPDGSVANRKRISAATYVLRNDTIGQRIDAR